MPLRGEQMKRIRNNKLFQSVSRVAASILIRFANSRRSGTTSVRQQPVDFRLIVDLGAAMNDRAGQIHQLL